ncbi:MAG: hypothetical protein AAFV49_11690 [Pseudomonadota bacterium]
MTRKRGDGPKGLDALAEMERRLGALFDELGRAFGAGSGGDGGTEPRRERDGSVTRSARIATPRGPVEARMTTRISGLGERLEIDLAAPAADGKEQEAPDPDAKSSAPETDADKSGEGSKP